MSLPSLLPSDVEYSGCIPSQDVVFPSPTFVSSVPPSGNQLLVILRTLFAALHVEQHVRHWYVPNKPDGEPSMISNGFFISDSSSLESSS